MVTREATRPLLVEIQALVDQANGTPKRVSVGLDQNRLSLQLAILHKHSGIATFDQDVFVNVVGGIKVSETASDLVVMLAIVSSLRDKVIPSKWIALVRLVLLVKFAQFITQWKDYQRHKAGL